MDLSQKHASLHSNLVRDATYSDQGSVCHNCVMFIEFQDSMYGKCIADPNPLCGGKTVAAFGSCDAFVRDKIV
jgi:hypothetical protein